MINKIYKNKKGGIEEGFTGFYSYTFIFIIFLIGFFVFSINPKMASESLVSSKSYEVNTNTVLRSLLNTPVDDDWTVADLLVFTSVDGCNVDLSPETLEVLDGYCLSLSNNITHLLKDFRKNEWQLNINYPNEKSFSIQGATASTGPSASYELPAIDGKIKLTLYASEK